MKKNNRRMKFIVEEKLIIFVSILCLVGFFAIEIFIGAQVSNIKLNIEKIDYKIEKQKKKNESLSMQINELTSYTNVSKVIENMGLTYNNENIVVISK